MDPSFQFYISFFFVHFPAYVPLPPRMLLPFFSIFTSSCFSFEFRKYTTCLQHVFFSLNFSFLPFLSSSPAPAPLLPFLSYSFCTRFTYIYIFLNSGSPPSTHLPFLLCPFPLLLLSSLLVLFFFLSYFHLFLCFFLFREYTSWLQYVFSLILSFHSLSSPSFPPTVPFSLYYFHLIFFNPGDLHHVTSSPNFSLLFSLSSPPAPLPPLCILSAILFSPFLLFSAGLKLVDCGRQVN